MKLKSFFAFLDGGLDHFYDEWKMTIVLILTPLHQLFKGNLHSYFIFSILMAPCVCLTAVLREAQLELPALEAGESPPGRHLWAGHACIHIYIQSVSKKVGFTFRGRFEVFRGFKSKEFRRLTFFYSKPLNTSKRPLNVNPTFFRDTLYVYIYIYVCISIGNLAT